MIITTIITFVIIFSLLIFLHEFGHFWTARKFGVRVDEFGFGLPPRLVGWHKAENGWKIFKQGDAVRGTIYSLNWIPFGGFVKLYGEDGGGESDQASFSAQGKLPRVIILSAGVAMNALFTILLLSIGFIAGTPSVIEEDMSPRATVENVRVHVVDVMGDSPAAEAGILAGDRIHAFNGSIVTTVRAFQDMVRASGGEQFTLTMEKENGARNDVRLRAMAAADDNGRAIIGVGLIRTGVVSYPWYLAFPEGIRATGALAKNLFVAFGNILSNLIATGRTDASISGPVGIAVLTGQVVQLGFIYILQFAATLSLNLAIINYIPFPALDGGRVFFILIEALRGKAASKRIEAALHTAGFALLIMLILFITYKDIARYGAPLADAFRRAW